MNKKLLIFILLIPIILLLICIGSLFLLDSLFPSDLDSSLPTEDSLIEKYEENKSDFDYLAQRGLVYRGMILEDIDNLSLRNDEDFYEYLLSRGISQEEITQYKDTLEKLGVRFPYWYRNELDRGLYFYADGSGLSVSGSEVGYLYSLNTPQSYQITNWSPWSKYNEFGHCKIKGKLVDSIYNPSNACGTNIGDLYRKIDENWYIYLSVT